MTMMWTNPTMNQVYDDIGDAIHGFIDKVQRETSSPASLMVPPAYVQPSLVANIEAEARGEEPPDDNPAAANYAKLGMLYGGDPAVDNMERIANAPPMFTDPDAPMFLGPVDRRTPNYSGAGGGPAMNHSQGGGAPPPYVAPTLTDLIANEAAEHRRRNGKGAAAAPTAGEQPPYIPPEMPW